MNVNQVQHVFIVRLG